MKSVPSLPSIHWCTSNAVREEMAHSSCWCANVVTEMRSKYQKTVRENDK